jgi:hypothetical protein
VPEFGKSEMPIIRKSKIFQPDLKKESRSAQSFINISTTNIPRQSISNI